ncbi:MAG: TonB-dependent receptor [Candidatus Eisenbacteria bacterium]|uniref:TonB-dependent receptor n=1 Tax=Eiseniibacteriota bacterium TaxID=2212470 RepID=A0A948RW33_UNCEI|nr:TonB-dependent receptor [Candidatus Eisenbacteria bacterium]MBU1948234.1 TonB-dependent receptor [Candidatus Eisenbacteria bacterium]MBU2690572.1 TonB-dependent receptor [Candidatus Eisenbacteria bacterium]
MRTPKNRMYKLAPPCSRLGLLLLLGILFLCHPLQVQAQDTGQIAGTVFDNETGKPLPYANVVAVGTGRGAVSQADGSFLINGVPPGPQEVRASYIGYTLMSIEVVVEVDRTVDADFKLVPEAQELKTVEVRAERPLVEVDKTSTVRSFNAEELKNLTLETTLNSVVEQQPGITEDRGRLHIRGGRSDETILIVDGVRMKDVLSGNSESGSISARSVAEVDIITGGFNAKYGEALSGVIETRLKDGTEDWHGSFHYETDHVISDWETDHGEFQLSGPNLILQGIQNLFGLGGETPTFFADISGEVTDTNLPSIGDLPGRYLNSSYEDNFFGGFKYGRFFYPRANNAWRGVFKTAWKLGPKDKVSATLTKSLSFSEGFGDVDIADIDRNNYTYPWVWKNRLDHYYTFTHDQNSFSSTWQHTYGVKTIQTLRLSRFFTSTHRDVAGKHWTEYDLSQDRDFPYQYYENDPYFIDYGDAPDYRDQYVETWGLTGDWAWTPSNHKMEWGFHSQVEEVQFLTINAASVVCDSLSCSKPLGDEFDLFRVYPTTGAFYLQDAMEYEGFIARLGLRYDYWFPGEQVERLVNEANRPTITEGLKDDFYKDTNGIFGRRFKGHLSPRIGISYPISQRDHVFFHYGHFSQRPAYFYVYAKSGSQSSEAFPRIGNPNLNPEVSVQYEIGMGHQFTNTMALKLTLFNKDIYDYPTSTTIVIPGSTTGRSNYYIYQNIDYARTRGLELELKKRRTNFWSGSVAYTYSVSKGKNSDPNALRQVQEAGGDARETELEEIFLWWNRPHKLAGWLDIRFYEDEQPPKWLGIAWPKDIGLNIYYMIRSGRAYTPQTVDGLESGQKYSRNGPFDSTLNFTLTKGLSFWGKRWEVFLQGWNVFNHRTPRSFDWATGKKYKLGEGSLDSPFENPENLNLSDEELIDVAGYEVGPDQTQEEVATGIRRTIQANISRYANPSYLDDPRHFRLGLTMEW